MVKIFKCVAGLLLATFTVSLLALPVVAADNIMTKETLKTMLDNPDVYVLDVRTGRDWTSSEFKIQGAKRANPYEFNAWQSQYPKDKTYVLYCA